MKSQAERNHSRHLLPLGISKLWQRYMGTSTGWHRAAKVNCVLLVALNALLLGVFIYAAVKPGSILNIIYIYNGSCDGYAVPLLNLFLHLLINITSTLVILNAPSREELDAAHSKGTWMEIGVSSIRNIFRVSGFKRWCWFGLALTSLPIHLFFNSVIFSTGYRGSFYTTTIATEEFVNGGGFYLPGASLLVDEIQHRGRPKFIDGSEIFSIDGYGYIPSLDDYTAPGSEFAANISTAARNGSSWDKLSFSACKREFGVYGTGCSGLTRYSDLLLIIDRADGWVRSDMWHLTENQSQFWDSYVPADEPNHLFFYTQCNMMSSTYPEDDASLVCYNNCYSALGDRGSDQYASGAVAAQWPSGFPFFTDDALSHFNVSLPPELTNLTNLISGLQPGYSDLSIKYCLARRIHPQCHIGISRILLLSVVIFILCKTSIAVLVTRVMASRSQSTLVTLGDCMASLIETPDLPTSHYPAAAITDFRGSFFAFGPVQWRGLRPRRIASVPRQVWALSYLLFSIAISVCIYLITTTILGGTFSRGQFLSSDLNPVVGLPIHTFLPSVLVANAPQILLSLSYVAFNNLFTYFCVAIEWEAFSSKYLPLRVTDPKDEQISTYRLQLPYRYSLSLMTLSVSLHWLVSNTIYVIVSEGGFWKTTVPDPGFPTGAVVALGYSPISLVVFTVVAIITVTIPLILGLKRLSSNMIHVGTNSRLISLVCHASPLLYSNSDNNSNIRVNPSEDELSEYPVAIPNREELGEWHEISGSAAEEVPLNTLTDRERDGQELSLLQKVSRSKVRWGVLPTSPEFEEQHDYELLGFGVEADNIAIPIVGKFYIYDLVWVRT
ncbi:hypothetical protein F5Y10DRAFT_293741 [Nemania abortiva]|nr:hypothetical protein F5Y10DRAFT_293741 [Nemania abortiva]